VFIEQNALILRFLRHNLKDLKGVTVIRGDVLKVLKRLKGMGINLVIADPPYLNRFVQATIDKVAELGVLEPGGLLVVEHHRLEMPDPPAGWEAVKQGNYGESMVTILRRGK
jgi:16S rRNA G966 N2-methylase RsmD